jgi:hypothetical protein
MLKSKLIEILKTISFKDLNRLDAYLHLPIYNKNEKVLDLFNIIKQEYPSYGNNTVLEKENIIKQLFPDQQKQDAALRVVMSQLSKLVEDFFTIDCLQEDFEQYRSEIYLKSLVKKGLNGLFRKELDEAIKKSIEQKEQIIPNFLHQHELTKQSFNYNVINNNRLQESGLQQVLDSLDVLYIASKLKYACAALNRQDVLGEKFNFTLIDEILLLLQQRPDLENNFITIYKNVLNLLKSGDETYYKKIKQLISKNSDILSDDDKRDIYAWLTNYCTKKIKSGQDKYLHEIFDLYKVMLAEQMLLVDNFFMPNHYKNIVITALKLKEYDWTQDFIYRYATKLPLDIRETVFNYTLAALHFDRKEYDEALFCLMKINPIDPYYGLNYRALLCKTYYELSEFMALNANLESFRVFVLREKQLSEYNNLSYKNFINVLKRLIRCKEKKKKTTDNLLTEMSSMEPLVHKQWLLEKIQELNK